MKGTTVPHQPLRPFALALVAMSLLFAGCGGAGAGTTGPDPSATAAPAPPSTADESPLVRSPDVPPSGSPSGEPAIPEPPAASIGVEGGDPVVGELGSFGWQNSGSDSPWLPGSPIHVGSGERLTLSLAEPLALASWTAARVPADDRDGQSVGLGEGSGGPVAFDAPPPGTWSVQVTLWFAGNLGSAAWYWRIEVD
jgi:hypothetical protein